MSNIKNPIKRNDIIKSLFIVTSEEEPHFFVVNHEPRFPRVDGDEGQQWIIDGINLKEKCKSNPPPVVVDVGGFIGDFGMRAAAYGCKVYIFEPTPFRHWMIQSSLELNDFGSKVNLYNYAISSEEGIATFQEKGGSTNQIEYIDPQKSKDNPSIFHIKTTTLDDIIPEEEILLLKVDVEGFEPTVLFGGSKEILKQKRVKHIISEYTPWWESSGKGPWKDFLDRMVLEFGTDKTKAYAVSRNEHKIFGPITNGQFKSFYLYHRDKTAQTDIYFDMFGENLVTHYGPWSEGIFA
jgi:FkbM family methyltransferase